MKSKKQTRATIYLEPQVHRALKLKAAETSSSISEIVSDAVKESLREDIEDLEIIKQRKKERRIPFEDAVKDLKRRGLL